MSRGHTHTCTRCKQPFGCSGELLRNWDGIPETICDLWHGIGGKFRECEACVMTCFCDNCGERPATVDQDGDRLCLTCADARDTEQRASA